MTDFQRFRERTRDQQDGTERHVWGEQEYIAGAGSVIRVRGTDTEDEEAIVINSGFGFNLPKDSDAEVLLLSGGSDTNQKFALTSIPHASQRQYPEGAGGIQHPTTASRAVEINNDETWLQDGEFKAGPNKEVTISISGGAVTITTARLVINADVEINGAVLTHNGKDVGFEHKHLGVVPGGGISDVPV